MLCQTKIFVEAHEMLWSIEPQNQNPLLKKLENPSPKIFRPIPILKIYLQPLFQKFLNVPHLNKININLNLNTQIYSFCLFFIFYKEKAFQKLWKMVFVSSKKLFLFLRYLIVFRFSLFLSTVSRLTGSDQRRNFFKRFATQRKVSS